jgi:hypothetical protein
VVVLNQFNELLVAALHLALKDPRHLLVNLFPLDLSGRLPPDVVDEHGAHEIAHLGKPPLNSLLFGFVHLLLVGHQLRLDLANVTPLLELDLQL